MASTRPVVVIAHWQTNLDVLDIVLAHIAALRPRALAEAGCLGYEAFQSTEDPTRLVLIEHYLDRTALETHLHSAHYEELVVRRIRPLLTDRRVEILQPEEPA